MVFFLPVDPESREDCREDIAGTDLILGDRVAVRFGFAEDRASFDPAARQRHAPGGSEVIAPQRGIDLGSSSKLAQSPGKLSGRLLQDDWFALSAGQPGEGHRLPG